MAGSHGSTIILVLILLAAVLQLHPSAACVSEERKALLAFKAGITADPLHLLTSWTANGDCCSWFGTSCDSKGHITDLTLSPDSGVDDPNYYLKGPISPELAKLTHLKRLDLSSLQNLSGSLPEALGSLKNLQYFSVRRNKLKGSIPSSLGNLKSLTWIDLGDNRFTGDIPSTLGNIGTQLEYIYLGNNHLTGSIPSSLYALTGLTDFYLNDNHLTGGLSNLNSRLQKLTSLAFSGNKLTGSLSSEIGSLSNLLYLDMSRNDFTGHIPSSFADLKKLYRLTLDHNKLTGMIPAAFATNLKELKALDLSNNKLTGPIPQGHPFSDFPASSFENNCGLCDHPLPPCQPTLQL